MLEVSPFFEADCQVTGLLKPPRRHALDRFLRRLAEFARRHPHYYRHFWLDYANFFGVFIEHGTLYESCFDRIDLDD